MTDPNLARRTNQFEELVATGGLDITSPEVDALPTDGGYVLSAAVYPDSRTAQVLLYTGWSEAAVTGHGQHEQNGSRTALLTMDDHRVSHFWLQPSTQPDSLTWIAPTWQTAPTMTSHQPGGSVIDDSPIQIARYFGTEEELFEALDRVAQWTDGLTADQRDAFRFNMATGLRKVSGRADLLPEYPDVMVMTTSETGSVVQTMQWLGSLGSSEQAGRAQ